MTGLGLGWTWRTLSACRLETLSTPVAAVENPGGEFFLDFYTSFALFFCRKRLFILRNSAIDDIPEEKAKVHLLLGMFKAYPPNIVVPLLRVFLFANSMMKGGDEHG
jgi:hypothetical protein